MVQVLVLLAVTVVSAALLRASARTSFVILAFSAALVPHGLKVPNGMASQFTVFRFVLVAYGLGALLRGRASGRPTFKRTALSAAIIAYLAVVLVFGVALAASGTPTSGAWVRLLDIVDQIGLFFMVVAGVRELGDLRWPAKVVVVAFSVTAAIALIERLTGVRVVTTYLGHLMPPTIGNDLPVRGGEFRPSATFEFSQELGLVLACIVPLGLACTTASRRAWVWFGFALFTGAMSLLTISRTAIVALAVGGTIYLLVSRRALTRTLILAGALMLLVGSLLLPSVRKAYHAPDTLASVAVRRQRLPVVGALVADRTWTGLGLGALDRPVGATDNQYVLTYAELGVLGLCVGGALWGATVVVAALGVRGRGLEREVAAACFAGVVAALVCGAFIDLFSVGAARVFWLLAAFGCCASEARAAGGAQPRPVSGEAPIGALTDRRFAPSRQAAIVSAAALVVGLAGVGVLVSAASPRHQVTDLVFETWPVKTASVAQDSGFEVNLVDVNTVCTTARHFAVGRPDVSVTCTGIPNSAGVGTLRVAESTRPAGGTAVNALVDSMHLLPGFRVHVASHTPRALDNRARTAPLWLASAGLFLALSPGLAPRHRTTSA